jgi:hypothetical protein
MSTSIIIIIIIIIGEGSEGFQSGHYRYLDHYCSVV